MPSPRLATHDDIPNIRALIERSVRALSVGFYTDEEAEAGIAHVEMVRPAARAKQPRGETIGR